MEVHCERCGTGYSLDEARLGAAGGRVRCARCGHVFLVQRPAQDSAAQPPTPSPPAAPEGPRRDWRVRRREGSISSLRELTTLQRWIVEAKLSREDEVGLDGQNWRPLGTIPDLAVFFSAADALKRVVGLEAELAQSRAAVARQASLATRAAVSPEAPRAAEPRPEPPPASPPPRAPPSEAAAPPRPPPPRLSPSTEEPAFTKSPAGLGVTPTDDWEPPKLRRGPGVWVLLLLLLLALAAASAWAYFYVLQPEAQRAREEQARTLQLERQQAEHEAQLKAAEQRAKQELLQSLAAAAQDGGPQPPDAGPPPHGLLEAPPAPASPGPLAAPTLPASAIAPPESTGPRDGLPLAVPATTAAGHSPQTFEEWMAEATRRRTHERAAGALAAYDRALGLRPQSAEAHTGRGLSLLDLGRRAEALVEFRRALELDPRDGVAVLGLAETYRSLGRVEEARGAYQRYLEGWPGGSEARAARAALESLKE